MLVFSDSICVDMYITVSRDNKMLGEILGETPYEIILLNNNNEVSFIYKIDYINNRFNYIPF